MASIKVVLAGVLGGEGITVTLESKQIKSFIQRAWRHVDIAGSQIEYQVNKTSILFADGVVRQSLDSIRRH